MQGRIGENSKALRLGRRSIAGQVYLLTTTTYLRRPIFQGWQPAACASASLTEPRLFRDSKLLCWVLMPDHLHLLAALGESESLSALVRRTKVVVAGEVNRAMGTPGHRVWMPGFHDRALRRDKDLLDVARYIVLNPVRAGLVRHVGDYPYWNAVWI